MTRHAAQTIIEVIRLAVAVVVYQLIEPTFLKVSPEGFEILGQAGAAVAGALITLGLSWVAVPISFIELEFTDYVTRATIAGPVLELAARPNTKKVARFDVNYNFVGGGLIGRAIVAKAVKRGMCVDLKIKKLELSTENGDTFEVADVTRAKLDEDAPARGLWKFGSLSFATGGISTNSNADVKVTLNIDSKAAWIYRQFIRVSSAITTVHIVRK